MDRQIVEVPEISNLKFNSLPSYSNKTCIKEEIARKCFRIPASGVARTSLCSVEKILQLEFIMLHQGKKSLTLSTEEQGLLFWIMSKIC